MQKRRPDSPLKAINKKLDSSVSLRAWMAVTCVAAIVICADQFTKSWVRGELADGRVIHVIGSLQFVLGYNRGVAFGLGEGFAPVLVTVAVIGLISFLVSRKVQLNWLSASAVGLVLGGAMGNLCDRLFRDTGGAVVDFIDLQWWPVFNIADACIVVGALILVFSASRKPAESQ